MDRPRLVSASDEFEYDFEYVKVPCRRGQAMIFHPALAHGSTGLATSERILLLP
jgi:ectoine hydroxylase-related dioxygenase (phytanoyl-CoA dioxygenase family)